MGADEISSLLVKLQANPTDDEVRKLAALALDAGGKREDALTVLAPLINLTGHDEDVGLPCLCKRCFPNANDTATAEGMQFTRSFAVVGNRVLHYWMLADQDRAAVRESVTAALERRLAHVKLSQQGRLSR